ncbi:MAG: DUF58 domain-containing protein [Micromonosporaceae bacterium]
MVTWRTGAVVAVLAVTLPLWPYPWLGVAVYAVLVGGAVTVDLVLAAPLTGVTLHRHGTRQVRLGETTTVTLTVANRADRTLVADVRDGWVPSAGPSPYSWRVSVPPGGHRELVTTLTPTRRGDRPAVRVTVRSYGPLRLAYRQPSQRAADRMTPSWRLRVLPPFGSRRHLPEKLSRLRVLDGSVVTRGRGQGTEFDALREYVLGDDVRSIDWRAMARRETVVVRTWRPERDRRVLCVLDTGRTSAARVGDIPRLDAALDACLLLSALASRADDRVDLIAADTAIRASVQGASRGTLLPKLMQAMAPLQPALVETDFELVAAEVLRRERKRALVILFTALEPGAIGEGLLPALPALVARHQVLVAAVHDPVLAEMSARRGDVSAVYAAAAAERTLAERHQVHAALSRHGVEVVDAPADRFASAVADTYLRLKAAGRL